MTKIKITATFPVEEGGISEAIQRTVNSIQEMGGIIQGDIIAVYPEPPPVLAFHSTASEVKPPFRWVGGKRKLVSSLLNQLPEEWRERGPEVLVSPFLGGGAFELALIQRWSNLENCIFADTNPFLVNAWKQVENGSLSSFVKSFPNGIGAGSKEKCNFEFNDSKTRIQRKQSSNGHPSHFADPVKFALYFFVLQSLSHSGLWRTNKSGVYNVSCAVDKTHYKIEPNGMDKVRFILDSVPEIRLDTCGFAETFTSLIGKFAFEDLDPKKTFIFLDPPYWGDGFKEYSSAGWTGQEVEDLAKMARVLGSKGVKILQTNNMSDSWKELYPASEGWSVSEYQETQSIGSPQNNGKKACCFIKNY